MPRRPLTGRPSRLARARLPFNVFSWQAPFAIPTGARESSGSASSHLPSPEDVVWGHRHIVAPHRPDLEYDAHGLPTGGQADGDVVLSRGIESAQFGDARLPDEAEVTSVARFGDSRGPRFAPAPTEQRVHGVVSNRKPDVRVLEALLGREAVAAGGVVPDLSNHAVASAFVKGKDGFAQIAKQIKLREFAPSFAAAMLGAGRMSARRIPGAALSSFVRLSALPIAAHRPVANDGRRAPRRPQQFRQVDPTRVNGMRQGLRATFARR